MVFYCSVIIYPDLPFFFPAQINYSSEASFQLLHPRKKKLSVCVCVDVRICFGFSAEKNVLVLV